MSKFFPNITLIKVGNTFSTSKNVQKHLIKEYVNKVYSTKLKKVNTRNDRKSKKVSLKWD